MNVNKLFVTTVALSSVIAWGSVQGEDLDDLSNYACRDVLLASGDQRDLAIIVLHGYFLGKSGKTSFDKDKLAAATDRFLNMCLEKPDEKAIVAMEKALAGD